VVGERRGWLVVVSSSFRTDGGSKDAHNGFATVSREHRPFPRFMSFAMRASVRDLISTSKKSLDDSAPLRKGSEDHVGCRNWSGDIQPQFVVEMWKTRLNSFGYWYSYHRPSIVFSVVAHRATVSCRVS
jgi:hypothetical protein